MINLQLSDLSFLIHPLIEPDKEQFSIEVLYYANLSPIPTVIKDYMVASTFKARPGSKATRDKRYQNILHYKVTDDSIKTDLMVQLRL